MQFEISTWHTYGGAGLPSDWSPREQLYRSWLAWRHDHGWSLEWGTHALCGV